MVNEISVVICAYTEKRWDDLIAAVCSVQKQTLPAREIIVVIDQNPDLRRRVQEALPDVLVIDNRESKGASGSRNSGVAVAQGNILAFLDDDAIASPDWLEKIMLCYADPTVVGVGGKILPNWRAGSPSWFPDEFYWVVGCSYRGLPPENAPVRNLIGANMSVYKSAYVQVQGFLEAFGNNKSAGAGPTGAKSKWLHHHAGDEETEFCMRVTRHLPEGKWLYTPSAVVQHTVPHERTRWNYFLWRCYDEGLGKASLSRLHPASQALSAEREYVRRVLPSGIARGLGDALLRRDAHGLGRASAITLGLTSAAVGYLVGSISIRLANLRGIGLASSDMKSVEI